MSKFCPIVNKNVTYQFCQDCDDKICTKPRLKLKAPIVISDTPITKHSNFYDLNQKFGNAIIFQNEQIVTIINAYFDYKGTRYRGFAEIVWNLGEDTIDHINWWFEGNLGNCNKFPREQYLIDLFNYNKAKMNEIFGLATVETKDFFKYDCDDFTISCDKDTAHIDNNFGACISIKFK